MGVERVDASEGLEEALDLHFLLLLSRKEPQELVVLRSKFEDLVHPCDDVLEVVVNVGWSLPLVVHLLLPRDLGEMRHALLPLSAYPEALVELQSDIRERGLPDIALFELPLDPAPESLRDDTEGVLHSLLRVVRENVAIGPDVSQAVLDAVHIACDGAE